MTSKFGFRSYVAGAVLIILSTLGTVLTANQCKAEEVWIVKKQEEKKKKSWYLTDWLETRDRMMMMDIWLALHSPSPFEFYISPEIRFLSHNDYSGKKLDFRGTFGAFASIFGLEAKYETQGALRQMLQLLFRFRFFGYHDQSTNMNFEAGLRSRWSDSIDYKAPTLGGSLTLYLHRYFGLSFRGLYTFGTSLSLPDRKLNSGMLLEPAVFIDYSFLRVKVNYSIENEYIANTSVATAAGESIIKTRGIGVGLQLYF